MTKERIYLDTSVISVLLDPRDPFLQRSTQRFWPALDRYQVFISTVVEEEIRAAPEAVSTKMQSLVAGMQSLAIQPEATTLAEKYIEAGIFTQRSRNDALHVAVATMEGVDFIVSWNFRHLVKVKTRRMVNLVNLQQGYKTVEIVAPSEL